MGLGIHHISRPVHVHQIHTSSSGLEIRFEGRHIADRKTLLACSMPDWKCTFAPSLHTTHPSLQFRGRANGHVPGVLGCPAHT